MAKSKRTRKKPAKYLSRQRLWQIKKQKSGKCIICGKPRKTYAQHCDKCHSEVCDGSAWKAGNRGRPPNSVRAESENMMVI